MLAVDGEEYAGMVGKVLDIHKVGTQEHTTNGHVDDVVVDFSVYTYSDSIKHIIEKAFSEVYNEPLCFEDLHLSLVTMQPDELLSIDNERPGIVEQLVTDPEFWEAYTCNVLSRLSRDDADKEKQHA